MKRIIIILVILSILGGSIYFYLKDTKDVYIEEYTDVIISNNLTLEVYSRHKISEFISINNGTLVEDFDIDYSELGPKKEEVLYLNKDNKKRKAYVDLNVVDTVKPIILGSSSYTVKVGDNTDLIYKFLSADNYTKNPKREIIGNYDTNKIGKYNLEFKITDESSNYNIKKFTLNVVKNITPKKVVYTKTLYKDVVKNYKNEFTKIGLDVSKWQGTINFDKLKENNVEFIMIRVGYQAGFNAKYVLDTFFERNIKEANRVGIPVGIYFYTYALTKEDAYNQAMWVIEQIKPYDVSLPIAFDFEDWQYFSKKSLSIHDINEIATHFMDTIEDNGYKGMNYSSKYYLENIWNIDKYPVWLAHYTKKTDYKGKYAMWQLCNDGRISGINGAVDINIIYESL